MLQQVRLDAARLRSGDPSVGVDWTAVLDRVPAAAGVVAAGLQLARDLPDVPLPAAGDTASRWELLAGIAAGDLTVARVLEPHLDALAILAEAGHPSPAEDGHTWGVFASEGPGSTLTATPDAIADALPDASGHPGDRPGWRLEGVKPWCSIAGDLTRALVTAHTADGPGLFVIDLDHPGVRVETVDWVARGLSAVPSGPIEVRGTPGRMVGRPGWYLARPGFWWGGIGVAACWFGGCVGLARTAFDCARSKPTPTALIQLGRIDVALHEARTALADAADVIDRHWAVDPPLLAMRVRAVVAGTVETVLREVSQLLGPGPLAFDEAHARRVADLMLYVRQHHGDRDLGGLGQTLIDSIDSSDSATQPW